MNISQRSKFSMVQFFGLLDREALVVIIEKYGVPTENFSEWSGVTLTTAIREAVFGASSAQLSNVLGEVLRTKGTLRHNIYPHYRFDERWDDLMLCLELDGYRRGRDENGQEKGFFVPINPIIEGVQPVEDDLEVELNSSGLDDAQEVQMVIVNSADAFRRIDFNGCLTNARVALQTLATKIALERQASHSGNFEPTKWGQVVAYLRVSGFITVEQESGLTGVFSFTSPGSHIPLGFSEQEFARLGRALVLGFSYFLIKRYNAGE